jgi:S1-C subfamily serine protease
MNSERFYNRLGIGVILFGVAMIGMSYLIKPAHAEDNFTKQAVSPVYQLERNCSGVGIDVSKEYPEFKDKTYILTANHCTVEDAKPEDEFNAKDKSGRLTIDEKDNDQIIDTQQYVYDVLLRDVKNDLAVLKLRKEGLTFPKAILAKRDPALAENVWTVGYSAGLPNRTITDGRFGGFISMEVTDQGGRPDTAVSNGVPKYTASPAITGGNSGGGMFLKDGDDYLLVGIADMVSGRFANLGFYNTQKSMNDVVNRALKADKLTDDEKVAAVKEDSKKHD